VMLYDCSFTQSLLVKARQHLGGFLQHSSQGEESRSTEVVSAA